VSLLEVVDLHKRFTLGDEEVEVLKGVSFALEGGESMVVTGPSGSGKSTLLHLIGTLDAPTSGSVRIDGVEPHRLRGAELARFRNRAIGFVFQDHHLLPQYTVLENVLLPLSAFPGGRNGEGQAGEARAKELLERVGLARRLGHRPAELSGGERQRTAVARALVLRPVVLLCDEPTGSLDRKAGEAVGSLLFDLHRQEKNVLIVVTHSHDLAARFPRRLDLGS
jgi:lipoprotein-releasing system ATP-binding protein